MNYIEFRKKIDLFPLFETGDLRLILGKDFDRSFLNNLKNWQRSGYLVRIRKGLYIPADLKNNLSPLQLATKIYYPSYVSLETALGHYGIIPEAVFTTTSVTTKKTKEFKSCAFGNFSYQKIKREAFGGFETYAENGISYNLAVPEKALVDFFYLNKNLLNGTLKQFQSYRFNEEFKFNRKILVMFAKKYANKKVLFLVNNFIQYYAPQ